MVVSILKDMKTATQFRFSVARGVRTCRRGDGDETFPKVVAALEETRRRPPAALDAWAAKIEARRASLRRAKEVVEIVDFGAAAHAASGHAEGVRAKMAVAKIVEASKSAHWGRLLYQLTRHLRVKSVLEMGTCVGISASYLGAALEDQQDGRLVTLEGDPQIAALAEDTFRFCGITRARCFVGHFDKTFADALRELEAVDLAFIDGNHTERATIDYFEQLLPFMNEGGVIVFDDIAWSDGMRNAWGAIGRSEAVKSIFELGNVGIVTVEAR